MSRHLLLLLLLFLLTKSSSAQYFSDPFQMAGNEEQGQNGYFFLSGSYSANSTAITNKFYNTYLFGDYISDEVKNTSLPYLKENNRAGLYSTQAGMVSWRHGKSPNNDYTMLYVMFKNQTQAGITFNEDAYKLILYGNAQFAGKSVDINKSSYKRADYHNLSFGGYRSVDLRNKGRIVYGAGISVLNGKKYMDLMVDKSSVYTSESGDSIHADIGLTQYSANPDSGAFIKNAGWGGALSAFVKYYFNEDDHIGLSVNDLGFIHWSRNVENYNFNNAYSFTGVDVELFNKSVSSLNFNYLLDSIAQSIDSAKTRSSFTATIPFQVNLVYSNKLNERFRATGGAYFIGLLKHRPEFFAVLETSVLDCWQVGTGASIWGYGKYGIILSTTITLKERWKIALGTDHLEGFLIPDKTFGQGAFINISGKF